MEHEKKQIEDSFKLLETESNELNTNFQLEIKILKEVIKSLPKKLESKTNECNKLTELILKYLNLTVLTK